MLGTIHKGRPQNFRDFGPLPPPCLHFTQPISTVHSQNLEITQPPTPSSFKNGGYMRVPNYLPRVRAPVVVEVADGGDLALAPHHAILACLVVGREAQEHVLHRCQAESVQQNLKVQILVNC